MPVRLSASLLALTVALSSVLAAFLLVGPRSPSVLPAQESPETAAPVEAIEVTAPLAEPAAEPAAAAPAPAAAGDEALATGAPMAAAAPERPPMWLRSVPGGRYFVDPSGRAVYLTGSHTWANVQDWGPTNPPPPTDYPAHLDWLQRYGHNFTRLWVWENAVGASWRGTTPWYFGPTIYSRTGPGTAIDGEPKFDLRQWNPAYFQRLRERVVAARERGIYVSVMLFQGWSIEKQGLPGNPWLGHPFHPDNNINGINGDPNGDAEGKETHTLDLPPVTALQEAYVRQVVDTVNDLDNVLYEISNESGEYSVAWQHHMVRFVQQYQASKPHQHPVGMSKANWTPGNQDVFGSPADWVSPDGHATYAGDPRYRDNPPLEHHGKVVVADTDHIWGVDGDGVWVWKTFTRGLNPIFMDPYDAVNPDDGPPFNPKWESARWAMGQTRQYAERLDLNVVAPRPELASSGYCLAAPGTTYLVYLPQGGDVTVDLSAAGGVLQAEWFSPSTGQVMAWEPVPGGSAQQRFSAPFAGDAVLFLSAAPPAP